jgi:hypothetical protein
VLEFSEDQMRLLSLFDGDRSIGEIAHAVATENDLSEAEALLRVKGLFFPLAKLAVLVPGPRSMEPDGV